MAASAPETAAGRQFGRASPRTSNAMRPRPGRAPTLLRTGNLFFSLHALLLLAPSYCFPPSAQLYVVCKDAASKICVTWPVDHELATELTRQFHQAYDVDHCGLSDLKPIPPHQKFIKAVNLFSSTSTTFFCNTINLQPGELVLPLENFVPEIIRTRRQAPNYRLRGRYRGQTQSQYLSIDRGNGKDEGKAEAHSAADSSRAIVSGNSGMGQAQSQTVYDPSCEDCIGRSDTELASLARGPKSPGNGQGLYNPDLNHIYNKQGQIPGTSFHDSNEDGSRPNIPGQGQNINQHKPLDNNYLTNHPRENDGRNGLPQYNTQPIQQGGGGILNNGNTPNQPSRFGKQDGSSPSNQPLAPENILSPGVFGSNLPNRPGLTNQPPNANNQWTNGLPSGNIDLGRIPANVNGDHGSGSSNTNIPNGIQQTPNNVYSTHQTGSPNGGILPNQNTLSPNLLPTQTQTPNGNTFTNYPGSGGGSGGPNINNQGNPFNWPILSDILRQRGAGSTYFCCVVGPDNNIQNLYGPNSNNLNRQPPLIGQNNVHGPNGGTSQTPTGPYGGTGQSPTGQYGSTGQIPNGQYGGSGQNPASQYGGTGQTPTGQYGGPGQGSTGPYGGTGQTSIGQFGGAGQMPTGQYGSTGTTPNGQIGGNGLNPTAQQGGNGLASTGQYAGTGQIPSGQYGGTGQIPIGQYGGTGQTPTGTYGGMNQLSPGKYGGTMQGPTGTYGGEKPPGQYGGLGQMPTGQYGGTSQTPTGHNGGTGQAPIGQIGGIGQTPSGQYSGTGQTPTGQYPSGLGPTGSYSGTGQSPTGQIGGTNQIPTGQYGGTGQTLTSQYGGTGQTPTGQIGGTGQTPTGQYGVTGQTPNGQYGGTGQTPTGQIGGTSQTPTGQYGGIGQTPTGQYGGTGQTPTGQYGGTGQTPTGQYGGTGQTATGQYGGTGQTPTGQYGGTGQTPTGQYGGTGQTPNGQYGGTGQTPNGQYGGTVQTPTGQIGGTSQTPTGQYGGIGQTPTGLYGGTGQTPTNIYGGPGQETNGPYGGTGQNPIGPVGGTGQTPGHGQYGGPGQTPTGPYGGLGQTGPGNLQTSTGPYGGTGQTSNGPYGGPGQTTNGAYGGTGQTPNGPYGATGQTSKGPYGGTGQTPNEPSGGTSQTSNGPYGGTGQTPNGNYGGTGQTPNGPYGGTGQTPNRPYGGTTQTSNGPYGGTGQTSNGPYGGPGQSPNGSYGSTGQTPNGPYGGTGQTPNGPYGGTGQTPNGPYGSTGQTPNGPYGGTGQTTNGPYGGTGQAPNGPYGGTGQTPNGPYGGTGQTTNGPYGGQQTGVINNGQGFNNQGHGALNNEFGGIDEPQNVVDPNSISSSFDDYNSEAQASVAQAVNGTTALASSKGGNEKGRAQTQVEGTYSGTGSFSANAEISDDNKAAQSHVSGSKKGASSSAEGRGRKNKSQASVKLGSETGSILTDSQSSGDMHSSSSQVQGSVKGGMADAQAKGPGSTSSQAQIGFTPYKEQDKEKHDILKSPFEGGGTASAQSSRRMGTSQSQLRGTFKYGISYNGAAQAGSSLDKDAVFSNLLPFDKIDVFDEKNKNINIEVTTTEKSLDVTLSNTEYYDQSTTTEETENEYNQNTEKEYNLNNENSYSDHQHLDHHKTESQLNATTRAPPIGNRRSFQTNYPNNGADYEYPTDKDDAPEEYEIDDGFGSDGNENVPVEQGEYANYDDTPRDTETTHQSLQSTNKRPYEIKQTTGGNTQHIILGSLNNHDAKIIQRNSEHPDETRVYQPGEKVPGMGGYTIPAGFTGSVKSVASKDKTYVVGSKYSPSQAQTVNLEPGTGKIKYLYPNNYGNNVNPKELRSLYYPKPDDNRYVSVSKSVTRDLDSESNIRKQYSHTYYTKSSSCGYFTFTCTMVSSAEGKKKVCKPKIPTNPDGTPMRC